MPSNPFDRSEHIYRNSAFEELVKDAIRFFNGTPVHSLPPPEKFPGVGVYALYYTGGWKAYTKYAELNRLQYGHPIYIGKAVPRGWRQARVSDTSGKSTYELHSRLGEHTRNIDAGAALSPDDFSCRFVILEGDGSDMIGAIEASLIKIFRPLWNSVVDGFGNHTPGKGRFDQAKSDWDVIHPGRKWAKKCKGTPNSKTVIMSKIQKHLESLN
ncbi:MAG: Eco29kI family restriction endonuclease [Alphaproteobacteria bacterium]